MGVVKHTLTYPHGMLEHDYHYTKCAKSSLQLSKIMIFVFLERRAWQMSGSGQRHPHALSNNDNVYLDIALYVVVQIKTITIDRGRIT